MIRESDKNITNLNHVEIDYFKKDFRARHSLLVESFLKSDDPFINPPDALINIVSKEVMSENAAKSVREARNIF